MKVLDIIKEDVATNTREDEIIAKWLKNNPHLGVVEKYDPKASNFASRWIAENKFVNAEIVKGFMTKYGVAFTFLKAIGIIAPLVECVMHLKALDAMAGEKDSSGAYVHDIRWIKTQENAIVGVFLGSVIVDLIIRSIRSGVFVSTLTGLVRAGVMRTPGGGRAVIIAMLASEIGLTGLKIWLNSPEGLEWATHGLVIPLIVGGLGALGNIGLEFLRDKVKDATGTDIGTVTPNTDARKDAEKTARAGPTDDEIAKMEKDIAARTSAIR